MGVALRPAQRVYQNTGHVARRDQGREAARSAHYRLHRDIQADGRDPDPDPVQRALYGRADRGGGRLRARRCNRGRDQAVRSVEALLAHRASVQPDDRRDRQAWHGQAAGRHPARGLEGRRRDDSVRARTGRGEGQGRGRGTEAPRHHLSSDGKAEREAVRREMETRLWVAFAVQYPTTKPLFEAISAARA